MRVTLRERGIRSLILGIERIDTGFEEAYDDAGKKVSKDAKRLAPVLSGRLRRSIRVTGSGNYSRITAGNRAMPPYAPVQERGRYNNIRPKWYMRRALEMNRRRVIQIIERGVAREIERQL